MGLGLDALRAVCTRKLCFSVLGIWLSLPVFATDVENNPMRRKMLAALCLALGLIGFLADVKARHDSDRSNRQLMDNTNALVTDTKTLIGTTTALVGNTTSLIHSTNVMVNGLTDTMTKLRGMAASMQQTRRELASQTEFLNHIDLHVIPAEEFATKGQKLAATINDLVYEYNWKINKGGWPVLLGSRRRRKVHSGRARATQE